MRAFIPNQPVTTPDGLYEAILDTISELDGKFTIAMLVKALPYLYRVRNMVAQMMIRGEITRLSHGMYEWVPV